MEFQLLYTSSYSLLFIFLLSIFILQFKLRPKSQNKKMKQMLPPGPWKLPLIGSMHHLVGATLPHRALRDLARKYGPIMHLQLGEFSAVVISSPRLAREVMKTHDLTFADRPELVSSEIMFYNKNDIGFAPYGEYWRQMRKICAMELLATKTVKSFYAIREEEVSKMIASIRPLAGTTMDVTETIFPLASAITCRAAFGTLINGGIEDGLIELIKEALSLMGGFELADLFPSLKFLHGLSGMKRKLEDIHQKVDKIFDDFINERRANWETTYNSSSGNGGKERNDLLHVLLRLQKTNDLQVPLTDINIKAIIFEMFAAGTDNSSATIEFAMSEMIKHPRVMERAQAEVREALKGKDKVEDSDTQKLAYLKLVVQETLRLHPPGPLLAPRQARETCEIDGYTIPINTKVLVNAWAIGRDPEAWPDAEEFIPERFEKRSMDYTGNHFEYIPFGAGRRTCPGVPFALTMVELALAQLLFNYNWKLPDGMKPEDDDMIETFGLTIRREKHLRLIPTVV